jgi:hypothetical protein
VKRLRRLDDKVKQRAEVAVYFQRFDEAETLYRDIDRKDLAIELRMRLGDWLRVVQLVQVRRSRTLVVVAAVLVCGCVWVCVGVNLCVSPPLLLPLLSCWWRVVGDLDTMCISMSTERRWRRPAARPRMEPHRRLLR